MADFTTVFNDDNIMCVTQNVELLLNTGKCPKQIPPENIINFILKFPPGFVGIKDNFHEQRPYIKLLNTLQQHGWIMPSVPDCDTGFKILKTVLESNNEEFAIMIIRNFDDPIMYETLLNCVLNRVDHSSVTYRFSMMVKEQRIKRMLQPLV